MIFIMSPSKTFHENIKSQEFNIDNILFPDKTKNLVKIIKEYSAEELAEIMKISKELSEINYNRYKELRHEGQGYRAIDYFYGEAFKELDAKSLKKESIDFAQRHMAILCGLYGIIRPLDIIMPYRLDVTCKLNINNSSLYSFWSESVTNHIMGKIGSTPGEKVLVNLSSSEYSNMLNLKTVREKYKIVNIIFKEETENGYKIIGTYAKKARGKLARHILDNKIDNVLEIKSFNSYGYLFTPELSNEDTIVFTRKR